MSGGRTASGHVGLQQRSRRRPGRCDIGATHSRVAITDLGGTVLAQQRKDIAVGEHWSTWRDEPFLIFVKIGTGIGSGFVAGGHVRRGADGAAGDIGHIHVPDHDDVVCRCGNLGCLEAVAGGSAMAARLAEPGRHRHRRRRGRRRRAVARGDP